MSNKLKQKEYDEIKNETVQIDSFSKDDKREFSYSNCNYKQAIEIILHQQSIGRICVVSKKDHYVNEINKLIKQTKEDTNTKITAVETFETNSNVGTLIDEIDKYHSKKKVESEIQTVQGLAKYHKTEPEDENGNWNDNYSTNDGFYVIHKGKSHHVYSVIKTPNEKMSDKKEYKFVYSKTICVQAKNDEDADKIATTKMREFLDDTEDVYAFKINITPPN